MPRRKKQQHKIDKKMIIDAFAEMVKQKNIDVALLQGIIEETMSLIVKKKYGSNADFEIVVNMQKGDIEIYLIKQVVEEVQYAETEISLVEANMYNAEPLKIGDDFVEEITLDNIADSFGRRLVSFASQVMNQKIREVERDNLQQEYTAKQDELIVGELYEKRINWMIVTHNGIETKLLKDDQMPDDARLLKKNKAIKAVIKEVRRTPGGIPEIFLSRSCNEFVKRLFEMEIPEVNDGIIQIKGIAREPGERTKVSLISSTERIDPVGACVGLKGIRINSISKELNNENIDLIPYSDDMEQMIARSLAPAKVKEIHVSTETKSATVIVGENQINIAIGKYGLNVRLASVLTGYDIKILKEGGEDIEINEFEAELGSEVIQKLQEANITTAREFLDALPSVLLTDCGMNYDAILENRRIMLLEFEEKENSEYIEQLNALVENSSNDTVNEDTTVDVVDNSEVEINNDNETVEEMVSVAEETEEKV
jgi:N utilization substance protein A